MELPFAVLAQVVLDHCRARMITSFTSGATSWVSKSYLVLDADSTTITARRAGTTTMRCPRAPTAAYVESPHWVSRHQNRP